MCESMPEQPVQVRPSGKSETEASKKECINENIHPRSCDHFAFPAGSYGDHTYFSGACNDTVERNSARTLLAAANYLPQSADAVLVVLHTIWTVHL